MVRYFLKMCNLSCVATLSNKRTFSMLFNPFLSNSSQPLLFQTCTFLFILKATDSVVTLIFREGRKVHFKERSKVSVFFTSVKRQPLTPVRF